MHLFDDREALRAIARHGDLVLVLEFLQFTSWELKESVARGFRASSACTPATWSKVCVAWPDAGRLHFLGDMPGLEAQEESDTAVRP